jgi:predicted TIM-barrel fold metal-dependent hydrolase
MAVARVGERGEAAIIRVMKRRQFLRLGGAAASSAVATAILGPVPTSGAQSGPTPVHFDVPAGTCDCHVHIHADPKRFPFFAGRVYTPPPASPEELATLHKALHIDRVVIVTPSVYGTDNAATLFGMQARGRNARAVGVIDERTTDRELDAMDRAGMRGIRLNLATAGVNDPTVGRQRLEAAFARMTARHWHVQMNTTPPMIAAIADLVAKAPVPVVFDHFGGARAELGPAQPGFQALVNLVGSGKAYVKISAAYRTSTLPDYRDVLPLAQALIAANADRVLWGTDWPHPNPAPPPGGTAADVTPFLTIDDGRVMNLLSVWAPDAVIRRKILVDNPATLYGFA